MAIDRRVFVFGAPLAGLGVAAAGVLIYRNAAVSNSAVTIGDDYEKYLAQVASDYRAGKLGVIDGWILSATEVRTYREMVSD